MSLVSKERAVLERPLAASRASDEGCVVRAGCYVLDRHAWLLRDVSRGVDIELTRLEFKLLDVLMCNSHHAVARDVLYDLVWGHPNRGSNSLEVTVNYLRQKLGSEAIRTVRGFGYQFDGAERPAMQVSA